MTYRQFSHNVEFILDAENKRELYNFVIKKGFVMNFKEWEELRPTYEEVQKMIEQNEEKLKEENAEKRHKQNVKLKIIGIAICSVLTILGILVSIWSEIRTPLNIETDLMPITSPQPPELHTPSPTLYTTQIVTEYSGGYSGLIPLAQIVIWAIVASVTGGIIYITSYIMLLYYLSNKFGTLYFLIYHLVIIIVSIVIIFSAIGIFLHFYHIIIVYTVVFYCIMAIIAHFLLEV